MTILATGVFFFFFGFLALKLICVIYPPEKNGRNMRDKGEKLTEIEFFTAKISTILKKKKLKTRERKDKEQC